MTSRQTVAAYWLSLVVLAMTAVGSFHQGVQRGVQVGKRLATSTEGIANGVHAAELIQALDAGRRQEVRRGLDLMIDAGIATHFLRVQTPDATDEADPSLEWHYAHLLEHRRNSPSTSQTEHIGRTVVAALGPAL